MCADSTILIKTTQLNHLLADVLVTGLIRNRMGGIMLQIIKPKTRLAQPAPGVMLHLPGLAREKRFFAATLGLLSTDELAKVPADQVMLVLDIELVQQETRRPVGVLDVEDAQDGLVLALGVSVHLVEAVDVVYFLDGDSAHTGFACICARVEKRGN